MPGSAVELLAQARAKYELDALGLNKNIEVKKHTKENNPNTLKEFKALSFEVDSLREKVQQIQKKQAEHNYLHKENKAEKNNNPNDQIDKKYYGLNKLDEKLEIYLDYKDGYYVEIGANDGLNQSNTAYFEKLKGWHGILVEPILHNFLACKKNRSPENEFFCAACVSFDYEKEFVKLHYANLMTAAEGVQSDIENPKEHADSGKIYNQCENASTEILAQARTMQSILDEANAPKRIDLLSLDVEGAEIEVLHGINHQCYRFNYILVECRNIERMEYEMKQNGYMKIDKLSVHDYLFKDTKIL
ncbi:MAG: FkbM family methyltransferase [Methylomicrobium sp.]|nr:FkbM family methyltransferase [Methylomicrobium sp.]